MFKLIKKWKKQSKCDHDYKYLYSVRILGVLEQVYFCPKCDHEKHIDYHANEIKKQKQALKDHYNGGN